MLGLYTKFELIWTPCPVWLKKTRLATHTFLIAASVLQVRTYSKVMPVCVEVAPACVRVTVTGGRCSRHFDSTSEAIVLKYVLCCVKMALFVDNRKKCYFY